MHFVCLCCINTQKSKQHTSWFFALQILLTAVAAVVLAYPVLALPHRAPYVSHWPRIPGRFYIRQIDPTVTAKDRVASGPVAARPISVAAAAPPRAVAPESPDFPAGTTKLGWCKLWKAWCNAVRWCWRAVRFVIPLTYRNDNKWCILRLSIQSTLTTNIQPDTLFMATYCGFSNVWLQNGCHLCQGFQKRRLNSCEIWILIR